MSRRELEASVEDDVVAWAQNRGWFVRKMQYVGRRGCPDCFFFRNGKMVIIEFKRPGIGAARVQQQREHARYAVAGFKVHVVNDRDAAVQLLGGKKYERD